MMFRQANNPVTNNTNYNKRSAFDRKVKKSSLESSSRIRRDNQSIQAKGQNQKARNNKDQENKSAVRNSRKPQVPSHNIPKSPSSGQMKKKDSIFISNAIPADSNNSISSHKNQQKHIEQQNLQKTKLRQQILKLEKQIEQYKAENQRLFQKIQRIQKLSEENKKLLKQKISNFNQEGEMSRNFQQQIEVLNEQIRQLKQKIKNLENASECQNRSSEQKQNLIEEEQKSQLELNPLDETLLINDDQFRKQEKGQSSESSTFSEYFVKKNGQTSYADSLDFQYSFIKRKAQSDTATNENPQIFVNKFSRFSNRYGQLPLFTVPKNSLRTPNPQIERNQTNESGIKNVNVQNLIILRNYETIAEQQELIKTLEEALEHLESKVTKLQQKNLKCQCKFIDLKQSSKIGFMQYGNSSNTEYHSCQGFSAKQQHSEDTENLQSLNVL